MNLLQLFLKHGKVSTDTRSIIPNSIFFALKGPNFNGNKFAKEALEKNAAWAVIDEKEYRTEKTILVDDVLLALQQLAKEYRQYLNLRIIGLTGSNGKTTTKELLHRVLLTKHKTFSTPGNLNNHIGVPLSLLQIPKDTEYAIIEMGDNKPGDIQELCEIAEPNLGFITNIGKDHIEGYGSIEGNLHTKNELFKYLNQKGNAGFFSERDPLVSRIGKELKSLNTIESFAKKINIKQAPSNPFVCFSIDNRVFQTQLVGDYNYQNILFAISIGLFCGVEPLVAADAVCSYKPENNRSQLIKSTNNTIILDAYNANPTSVELALKSFLNYSSKLPKVAILGDMLELGVIADEEHLAILDWLNNQSEIQPVLVGSIYIKFKEKYDFSFYESTTQLIDRLKKDPIKKALVLLKGSRGIKLETALAEL